MIVSLDLSQKRIELAQGIRSKYATLMGLVAAPYSPEERESWSTQIKEADAYLLDNTAVIPLISAMAASRGIQVDTMVSKIKENDALFCAAIGNLLGLQQKELDALGI